MYRGRAMITDLHISTGSIFRHGNIGTNSSIDHAQEEHTDMLPGLGIPQPKSVGGNNGDRILAAEEQLRSSGIVLPRSVGR